MRTTRSVGAAVAALALLAATAPAAPAPAETARGKVLALNQVTGEDAELGKIFELIEDAGHTKPLLAEAVKVAREKDQPLNVNATLILARTAQLLRQTDDSVVFYRLYIDQAEKLQSPEKIGEGYSGLIKTLYDGGKFEDSDKAVAEFLDFRGEDAVKRPLQQLMPAVLRQRVLILAKEGKADAAAKLIDKIIKEQPDNPLNQIAKGQFLREVDKPGEAVKAYEEAVNLIKKDEDLTKEQQDDFVSGIRYTLSALHMENNDLDKAAADLKDLLEKDPDNPGYNNDLGYIWADHDMNLPESEKLIRKAIEEDRKRRLKANPDLKDVKENASYLDSLGWVLFKEKKYKDALPPLQEALKDADAQSIEIYDHLAEVQLATGDKAAALATWKKGLELPAETKREKQKKAEVEKKLKANE